MQLDDAFASRQPQSQAIHFPGEACVYTMETVKDAFEVFIGYPYTSIADEHLQHAPRNMRCVLTRCIVLVHRWQPALGRLHVCDRAKDHLDHTPSRRVFDGVLEQVVQDLAQATLVSEDERDARSRRSVSMLQGQRESKATGKLC